MTALLFATLRLYRDAFRATMRSFLRSWMTVIAVVMFSILMIAATSIAAPLGIIGGFVLGAVNALLIGATLGLLEQAVKGVRPILLSDVLQSFGQYFWEVIGVGFILWVPMMLLDQGVLRNPSGGFAAAAILLLIFILLNPAPEVIYQTRHDSPLDVLKTSYEFIIEYWVEWFLPLAIMLAPFGLSFFFGISGRLGRGAGLDFFQILILPFTLLTGWLAYLGLHESASSLLVLILTPPLAILMMLFRGHLFALLHGSSRRQRLFKNTSRGMET
ncbi:MAG: hypothetical protein ACT4OO_10090 [Nitrospiraceae bacterium]